MKKILFLLSVILAVVGCQTKEVEKASNVFDGHFPIDSKLEVSSKAPLDLISASKVILSDSLIVLFHTEDDKIVHVYDRASYKPLSSFLTVGRAANEVLIPPCPNQWEIDGNNVKIFIYSYPKYAAWIDVNKSVSENTVAFCDRINIPSKVNSMVTSPGYSLGDSILMLRKSRVTKSNVMNYADNVLVGYDFKTNKELFEMPMLKLTQKATNQLMSSGASTISDDRRYSVKVFSALNLIALYDFEKQEQKEIYMSETAQKDIYLEQYSTYYYKDCIDAGDCFIALRYPDPELQKEGINSVIEVFDWDGNAKARFSFKEIITTFDVDRETNQLYAIVFNKETLFENILIYDFNID